ncbi:hypothetical protein OROMI_024857 [Orobanche minor]
MARVLFFKIRPSQEILKIRDGTPLEAEEILTYIKCPRNGSVCYFSSKLDVSSNVVQKKKVARILFFKIRSSQGILKVRDCTPMEGHGRASRPQMLCPCARSLPTVPCKAHGRASATALTFRLPAPKRNPERRPAMEPKIWRRSKRDDESKSLKKIRVRRLRGSEIGNESDFFNLLGNYEIGPNGPKLTKRHRITNPKLATRIRTLNELTENSKQQFRTRFARIELKRGKTLRITELNTMTPKRTRMTKKEKSGTDSVFKIRPSQEILKNRDGTPFEAEEILTYIKSPRNGSVCYFSRKLDVPSNAVQKKRVARILFFKIWPSQEILKIRDGTPLEAEEILTYIKSLRNGSVCYFSSKLDVPSNVVHKKRVARILFFKIRTSQEILKIRDGTYPFGGGGNFDIHKKPSKRIGLPSQEILKIRDGTPLELDVPSNVVQKKRVARILFFKIRSSQEILKIRDGTPLEAEEILTYVKKPSKRIE